MSRSLSSFRPAIGKPDASPRHYAKRLCIPSKHGEPQLSETRVSKLLPPRCVPKGGCEIVGAAAAGPRLFWIHGPPQPSTTSGCFADQFFSASLRAEFGGDLPANGSGGFVENFCGLVRQTYLGHLGPRRLENAESRKDTVSVPLAWTSLVQAFSPEKRSVRPGQSHHQAAAGSHGFSHRPPQSCPHGRECIFPAVRIPRSKFNYGRSGQSGSITRQPWARPPPPESIGFQAVSRNGSKRNVCPAEHGVLKITRSFGPAVLLQNAMAKHPERTQIDQVYRQGKHSRIISGQLRHLFFYANAGVRV